VPRVSLTAKNVATLRPRPGRERDTYFDADRSAPSGFCLRVTSRGARRFWFVYRRKGSESKAWLDIGDAARMPLADARKAAKEADNLRGAGRDPIEEAIRKAREKQQRPTVSGLIAQYIDANEGAKLSASTAREYRRMLAADIEGTATGRAIASEVGVVELEAILKRKAKGTPAMAINLAKLVKASFRWGFRKDLIERDISVKLDEPAAERRLTTEERTLSDAEVKRVWTGVVALGPELAAYLRIPLLCATRREETALAAWEEIDLKAKAWSIPPQHRKGRIGRERGLVVPLSSLALEVLRELEPLTRPSGRVFGDAGPGFMANPDRTIKAAQKATGVEFTVHDLRATCATGAGKLGAAPHVVALLLGHATMPMTPEVASRYDRADRVPEVAGALELWADFVRNLTQ